MTETIVSNEGVEVLSKFNNTNKTYSGMNNKNRSRRWFLSTMALGTAGTFGAGKLLAHDGGDRVRLNNGKLSDLRDHTKLSLLNQAPDGPVLKAGVVGCGGRGTEIGRASCRERGGS